MKEIKYQGNYITVTEEEINGHIYERAQLREGVRVIPIQNNKVLLMSEFRPHEKDYRWKLVSGWCDKEKRSPLEHAQEELAEELGMQAENWKEFFNSILPNATLSPSTHYFLCENISELEEKVENPDVGADINGHDWFSFDEIFHLINEGKMWPDDATMVVLWHLYNLKNKKQS